MNLVGCNGVYMNILKWANGPLVDHLVLIGDSGCGKSALISLVESNLSSKFNFIKFDCSRRINKKIVTDEIETKTGNLNVIDVMMGEKKQNICVFDEIDGTIECDNMSFVEICKILLSKDIRCILISSTKGIPKLQEVIKNNKLCRLGPYNQKDLLRYFILKYDDIDTDETKKIILECGSDVRKMIYTIENKIGDRKDDFRTYTDIKSCINYIIENDLDDGIKVIESDMMNLMFTVHENYHVMTKDIHNYRMVLKNLSYMDMFQQSMFENQQWSLNNFSHISLYDSISRLKPTKKELKTGTMWSKCSNWQYKKKLYNNFAFSKPNCIFHNMEFVYGLKIYLLNMLSKDEISKCVHTLETLNMDKENFEQLLRVSDIDGRKSEFKGAIKNKLLKSLKKA